MRPDRRSAAPVHQPMPNLSGIEARQSLKVRHLTSVTGVLRGALGSEAGGAVYTRVNVRPDRGGALAPNIVLGRCRPRVSISSYDAVHVDRRSPLCKGPAAARRILLAVTGLQAQISERDLPFRALAISARHRPNPESPCRIDNHRDAANSPRRYTHKTGLHGRGHHRCTVERSRAERQRWSGRP